MRNHLYVQSPAILSWPTTITIFLCSLFKAHKWLVLEEIEESWVIQPLQLLLKYNLVERPFQALLPFTGGSATLKYCREVIHQTLWLPVWCTGSLPKSLPSAPCQVQTVYGALLPTSSHFTGANIPSNLSARDSGELPSQRHGEKNANIPASGLSIQVSPNYAIITGYTM